MIAPWLTTTLPTILSRYPHENIFNADEFRLFYQCFPIKSLHLENEKCTGGKHSKVGLTGIAAINVKGERLSMFVVGKSKSPSCFKGVKNVPCRYRAESKNVEKAVIENLKDDLKLLKSKFDADFNLMADELAGIDFDVCIANKSSDEDIIAEVSGHDAIETEEESDNNLMRIALMFLTMLQNQVRTKQSMHHCS
ncbi:tigger transposable element-derived protein 4-like [Hydra vulgaris]|uniref:Tigger transposable element-derived protein 4-like n=1 Tax=Hydra vulgaris TaxID=6087 RepID=A0ABM4B2B0_HYDVU